MRCGEDANEDEEDAKLIISCTTWPIKTFLHVNCLFVLVFSCFLVGYNWLIFDSIYALSSSAPVHLAEFYIVCRSLLSNCSYT